MISRRGFMAAGASVPALGLPSFGASAGFPGSQQERYLFPCPADGMEVGVNPPGLAWWPAEGASGYRVVLTQGSKRVYESPVVKEPVHLAPRTFPPGEYRWDVEALDRAGKVLARRGEWRFRIPAGVPELPWEDPKAILQRAPDSHPRYVFLKEALPGIRESLKTTRKDTWTSVLASADRAMKAPMPEPPKYHTFEGQTRQRMGYTVFFREFRGRVDSVLTPLSIAYLLGGSEKYGLRAKQVLLEIESWGIEGPMSVLSPFGDEPGLSLARHGHRAYDWLYELFDSSERERVRKMTADRARQVLTRLKKANYLFTPAESHNGRMIAYLSEYAVVMKDEAPDSAEWLDYSLKALTTFYPHWGDADGGWAEGISYALAYNNIYLGALESLRTATGFDLYKRPFFGNVRKFFLYCTSPSGEIKPFGDGAEGGGPGGGGALLLRHHGNRFKDPVSVWWADQVPGARSIDPMLSLVTEDNVKPEPPSALPSAMVFRGVGWVGAHSALDDPKRDTFMVFKSSPFGSVSHSHADQNSFAIMKGGAALAIPSGYYGPSYGMPHHADWTRQTKANNSVLVDGAGQVVRSAAAQGTIAKFWHKKNLTYFCGSAAPAYAGKLTRFDRHVLFLRPGVFLMLDELEAPSPAEFSWLLHAFDKFEIDEAERQVISRRKGASLDVRLVSDKPLALSQTDVFDTTFNHGIPQEYHRDVANQWHFTAKTRVRAPQARIAALMVVEDAEKLAVEPLAHPGWTGVKLKGAAGEAIAWVQTTPGAKAPSGAGAARLLSARYGAEVFAI